MSAAEYMPAISDEQARQFETEGWFLLECSIENRLLDLARGELQGLIDDANAELDVAQTDQLGRTIRGCRYYLHNRYRDRPRLSEFLFSDINRAICEKIIGPSSYLYWETFQTKWPGVSNRFAWHQDSAYVPVPHDSYVTIWCALDDMTAANGALRVLPYSRAGTKELVEHQPIDGGPALCGYFGSDPGDLVPCPAGSIVVFSSTMLHCSDANTTDSVRRAYVVQFSPERITMPDGAPIGFTEPFPATLSVGR